MKKICEGCGMIREGRCPIFQKPVERIRIEYCYAKVRR